MVEGGTQGTECGACYIGVLGRGMFLAACTHNLDVALEHWVGPRLMEVVLDTLVEKDMSLPLLGF